MGEVYPLVEPANGIEGKALPVGRVCAESTLDRDVILNSRLDVVVERPRARVCTPVHFDAFRYPELQPHHALFKCSNVSQAIALGIVEPLVSAILAK